MELQCQHLMAAVPPLPPALARYQPLIDSMLQKQPQRRLQDGDAVLHEIDLINSPGSARTGATRITASRDSA